MAAFCRVFAFDSLACRSMAPARPAASSAGRGPVSRGPLVRRWSRDPQGRLSCAWEAAQAADPEAGLRLGLALAA